MAIATTATAGESIRTLVRPRLFTIDDVIAMADAGILRNDEHVELIEGQIVEMHSQGTRHVWAVSRLTTTFARRDDVLITPQSTFRITGQSGPEPDLVVLRTTASQHHHPSPRDTVLIIEVANTSLAYDRTVKGPLYARAGIAEYWIVDLNGERIEVYREPSEAGYRAMRFYVRGEHLSPAFAPDMRVEVDAILGPGGQTMDDEAEAAEAP
jgi:Uma2 family endonuclease